MIQVSNLQKDYDETTVLSISDLTISRGDSFGLVGKNGAGKTTLFRLILNLTQPSAGEIIIDRNEEKGLLKKGFFIEEDALIDFFTPREYLCFSGKLQDKSEEEILLFLEKFSEFIDSEILNSESFICDLEEEDQKKILIIAALVGDPELLILDDPFTGLSFSSQLKLKKLLNDVRAESDMTLLISCSTPETIVDVCRHIAVLENGHIVKNMIINSETVNELENYF